MLSFVAFDVETTGTLAAVDAIVEIGAVKFIDGQIDSVFSTLIDPGMRIPEAASRVNGITDEMVAGQPKIEACLAPFADFCKDLPIVAHNASFDFQFLQMPIRKYEAVAPQGPLICTLAMAKKVFPGLANYKLGTLVQHLRLPSGTFHRAEEDASYCGQLFIEIVNRLALRNASDQIETLIRLCGNSVFYFPQITPQPKQLDLLSY